MELNIPEASEQIEYPETVWLDHTTLEPKQHLSLKVDRVHIGEKAVCFFDDSNNKAISLFHISDFDGETLGERSLIALGQYLDMSGKTTADDVALAANNLGESITMKITLQSFKDKESGDTRTYKRISFKV